VFLMAMPAVAQTPTLKISLGTREPTNTTVIVGAVGGFHNTNPAGGIEWFNKDQQTLVLDGTWQQFTFDLSATGISASSFTGDGLISADKALLEHLRIMRPAGAGATNVELWIDKVQMTYDPTGFPPPATVTASTFDGVAGNGGVPYAAGAKVMFRDPSFSGSTSSMINATSTWPGNNTTGISTTTGVDDSYSLKAQWKWLYTNPTYLDKPWLRLASYYTTTWKEVIPIVAEAGGPLNSYASASVSVWLKGVPEPASLSLLALGGLALLRRR
jgi:hypothetical protein